MNITDLFKNTRAEDWFYYKIPASQTSFDSEIREVTARKDYVSVSLKSMRIVNVRKGLSKFYGAVHSSISIPHRGSGTAQFKVLTTPGKLQELDAGNIDKVISTNIPLLGPIPYHGGKLELELGLFSIKAVDLTAPVLSLLSNISAMSGVAFIGLAVHYLEPLKQGIEILTGSNDKTVLEIGLATTWDKLVTGNYVIMRVPRDNVNEDELFLDSDFRLTDKLGDSIRDYPYLVFGIDVSAHRYDYFNIPEIAAAYKGVQTELAKGDNKAAAEALKVFRRTVLLSNDLIYDDAKTICDEVEKEVNEILSLTTDVEQTRGENETPALSRLKDLEQFKFFM